MSQLDDLAGTLAHHVIRQKSDDTVVALAVMFIDILSELGYDASDWEWAFERADRETAGRYSKPLRAALQERVNEITGELVIDEG